MSRKRKHRIYLEEGPSLRIKVHKKRVSHLRVVPAALKAANERWAMNLVQDLEVLDEPAGDARRRN